MPTAIGLLRLAAFLSVAASAGCADRAPEPKESGNALAGLRLEPGLWEVRSMVASARAENLPLQVRNRLIGPRPARRFCISAAQAQRQMAELLAGRRGCVYRGLTLEGERLTGMMACVEPGAPGPDMVRLDGRYGPAGYDLRMEMTSPMPDGTPMTLDIRTEGRRLGDCGEGDAR